MTPESWVGRTIGNRYQVDALLGQGGMSAVYRAYDPNLRRVVAIKLIHPHLSSDPNFIGRFKEEAASVARLRHPNIVQVHDFNIDGDTYYMVMEYLVGETLQARLKRLASTNRYMPIPESIAICSQICEAAGYAHNHELIHRDIKPANIMLDVNGQAILMDFGIVKIVGGEYHTATGATIGTAMYMAPEQIRTERIDDRADIYSLGVTLFEMIGGRTPFHADSALTLMMMVLNDPLPDLSEIRKDVPLVLQAVVNKALAKNRQERYQSMAELNAALQPIPQAFSSPAPAPTVVEDRPAVQPQPAKVAPAGDPTTQNLESASGPPQPGEAHPAAVSPQTVLETDRGQLSPPSVEPILPTEPPPAPLEPPMDETMKPARSGMRKFLPIAITALVLLLLTAAGIIYWRLSRPPSLQLAPVARANVPLNAQTVKSLASLGVWEIDSIARDLSFSPDGTLLATANSRESQGLSNYRYYAGIWQLDNPALQRYLPGLNHMVTGVVFSPDGKLIATVSDDGRLKLWQVQDGSLLHDIQTSMGSLTQVDFSPNNRILAISTWDGIVSLWQADNGNWLRSLQEQEDGILDVKFSPDGSLLAAASHSGSILIWRVGDSTLMSQLQGHTAPVVQVVFSPDGSLLASAAEDHTVRLWNVADGSPIRTLTGHTDVVTDVAFALDGSMLASGSQDASLLLWRVADGELLASLSEPDSILSLDFSPDGGWLVTGVANGDLRFWGVSEAFSPIPASP